MDKAAELPATLFFYVLGIIIVAVVLLVGYRFFISVKGTIDSAELLSFKKQMLQDFSSVRSDFGTTKKLSYALPDSYSLCFTDNSKRDKILASKEIKNYPLMHDAIRSNTSDNVFILSTTLFDSFATGKTNIASSPHFICIFAINNKVHFFIEGAGDSVRISASSTQQKEAVEKAAMNGTDAQQSAQEQIDDTFDDLNALEEDMYLSDFDAILTDIETQ